MFVREDSAVNELLHFGYIATESSQGIASRIFGMPDDAEKEMVGGYSIAACPHRLFARIVDN